MLFTRRQLAAGLALAGVELNAQPEGTGSLYIPKPQLIADRKMLHEFMAEFSFVDLVTSAPEIRITHIPVLLDRNAGQYGKLYGHISRQNPQSKSFDGRQPAVVVFRGPHAYVSPSWYAKMGSVPTWNFAIVHASGKPRAITEKKALRDLLAKLIDKFEDYRNSAYDFSKVPASYIDGLMEGIIGFEMEIERLEGKFKLGQERNEADRQSVLKSLETAKRERSMHDFTASFYERMKTSAE
jgi:transcriptional regulator